MLGAARSAVSQLPNAPGVYRFRDAERRVLYVGRAVRLRSRVGSYWNHLGDRQRLRRMVERITSIDALACDSEHEAAWLERNLLEHNRPRWNRTIGTEVPVFVCIDDQVRAPRLCVVHSTREMPTARHFGPFLGGARIRTAVSGLHRAVPLAYAGAGVSGAERDIARIRDIAPADRERLIDAIRGVLSRDPAAVAAALDSLARQRNSASDVLAFELAAQLQAEIECLEWLVAEQKVTSAESYNFEFYGWAHDTLVCFEVRGGRLCDWHARPCSEAEAHPLLRATPSRWAVFAQRNAELAARLAG